jgi:hypothetical protein
MPGDPGFRRGQAELPRTPARRVPQSPQGSSQNIDPGALMPNSGCCSRTYLCVGLHTTRVTTIVNSALCRSYRGRRTREYGVAGPREQMRPSACRTSISERANAQYRAAVTTEPSASSEGSRRSMTAKPSPSRARLLSVGSSSGSRPGTARRRRVQIIGCTTIGSDRVPLRPGETGPAASMVEVAVAEDHRLDLGQVAAATRSPPWTPSSRCARVR